MSRDVRIAMWSGPRNVSTALMRSFGSRADTCVFDEPFYAHWLEQTGADHPGREEIMRSRPCDWRDAVDEIMAPLPDGKTVRYQKHPTHHLTPMVGRDWIDAVTHAFLVREPRAMLASLIEVVPQPTIFDTGLPQQVELFDALLAAGGPTPPVVDSRDLLEDPAVVLAALCERLGIPYDPAMLAWEKGSREADGCWAPYWYASVEASTGFYPYAPRKKHLPTIFEPLAEACDALYTRLAAHKVTA